MARRGRATAESLEQEVADLGPAESTFTDPLRAERPERDAPDAPEGVPPPSGPPLEPPPDEGGGEEAFDAKREFTALRQEHELQRRRNDLLERELLLARSGQPAAGVQGAPSAAAALQGQPAIDPILQEGMDILNVTEDDLVQVFSGGAQGAQLVSRALQTVYLLAVNATERRLLGWYQNDQGRRSTEAQVAQRSQEMHTAFWTNYPELQEHEIVVQHFAAEVAREQQQSPRFDWDSAQREVATRTVNFLRQRYNVALAVGGQSPAMAPPRQTFAPTLQSRLRPATGEMGGGRIRNTTPSTQQQLVNEILDLGR
jgi:hypothetical protein